MKKPSELFDQWLTEFGQIIRTRLDILLSQSERREDILRQALYRQRAQWVTLREQLLHTGYRIEGDPVAEIDATIDKCYLASSGLAHNRLKIFEQPKPKTLDSTLET